MHHLVDGAIVKRLRADIGTGVVDEQSDLEIVCLLREAFGCVAVGQAERDHTDIDRLGISSDRVGKTVEHCGAAGHEHNVDALGRELPSELFADSLRGSCDHGPRTVLLHIDHDGGP